MRTPKRTIYDWENSKYGMCACGQWARVVDGLCAYCHDQAYLDEVIDYHNRRHTALEQAHITLLKQLEALQLGMAEDESCSFWAQELKKITDEAGEV